MKFIHHKGGHKTLMAIIYNNDYNASECLVQDQGHVVSQSSVGASIKPCLSLESKAKKRFTLTLNLTRHPTSKLSQKSLINISRLLVMYKDCPERGFYHLEVFYLF